MSKMSNAMIRDADARSLDNAEEVRELRAELGRLRAAIGRADRALEACGDDLIRLAACNAGGLAIGLAVLEVRRGLREAGG